MDNVLEFHANRCIIVTVQQKDLIFEMEYLLRYHGMS